MQINNLVAEKTEAYAMAADDDIAATRFEQVRDRKLWRGWIGTVYGMKVQGGDQFGFDTYDDARADALQFVERCAQIISDRRYAPADMGKAETVPAFEPKKPQLSDWGYDDADKGKEDK
jgi:hypothetical protein